MMDVRGMETTRRKSLRNISQRPGFGYGFSVVQDPAWSLAQVLLATGGRFLGGRTEAVFRRVSTDTRTLEPGDLFVALVGENFDGHAFLDQAMAQGAAGLVVSRPPERLPRAPVILVADTLAALGDLARYRRQQMVDLQVLAITGSSGKTTVKEMTAAILAQDYNVLKSEGNFNNLVGLPLSLMPVEYYHDFAVLEMGMNRPGEISRLAEIADPEIACITNVQAAHLAGLASIEGVARAKGELFAGVKSWGTLVVNSDDRRVRALARRCPQRQVSFGRHPRAMVRATYLRSLGDRGMSFTLHLEGARQRIRIRALGSHNVQNALAAAAMAYAAGASPEMIAAGLAAYRPYEKRLQVQELVSGIRLINDTYNANPASMLAALETLADLRRGQRVAVLLGDMLELGDESRAAHRFIGEHVGRLGFDHLLAVGGYAEEVVTAARRAGMDVDQARVCADKGDLARWLRQAIRRGILGAGDLVLLKGSRGMRMETVVEGLVNPAVTAQDD